MAHELGDRCFEYVFFDSTSESFADVLNTTWAELVATGHLLEGSASFGGARTFKLTAVGWIEMLQRIGRFETVCEKLSALRIAAKALVKGRGNDQGVPLHDLAVAANVSDEWLVNVIQSRLLQKRFPDDEADLDWWSYQARFLMVRIPIRFGMRRLPR